MAYCTITLIGNVGRDPEMRYTPAGKPVTEFSVAVGHSKPDGSGGWTDESTDWFRVTVWADRAERIADTVRKGSRVFVTGRFATRAYTTKDGTTRTSMDIVASDVVVLDRTAPAPAGATQTAAAPSAAPSDADLDNLPF